MNEDGRDFDARKSMQGLINIHLQKPTTHAYRQFEEEVRVRNTMDPFEFGDLPEVNSVRCTSAIALAYMSLFCIQIDVHAGTLYDAVMLFSYAVNESLALAEDITDGKLLIKHLYNRSFSGRFFLAIFKYNPLFHTRRNIRFYSHRQIWQSR